jgi:hypothetical protein
MLALIVYKHVKHVAWKELIDPRSEMIPIMQRWDKITKELQNKTKIKNRKIKQCARTSGMHSILTTKIDKLSQKY